MRNPAWRWSLALTLLAAACSSGGGSGPTAPARFAVSVHADAIAPEAGAAVPVLDLQSFGVKGYGAVYRVTTPADEPFAFDLIAWNEGGAGTARVRVAHVGTGGNKPSGGVRSLAEAGLVPSGQGLFLDADWFTASGDGFARLSIQGRIQADQVLAVESAGGGTSLVMIELGPRSVINQEPNGDPENPHVVARDTIYSSDAWTFAFPAVAVSGDRTTIVTYDGDRTHGMLPQRYEVRMQHDAATGQVTGGGSVETGLDTGNWRDHEIAALYNVLAVARAESGLVRVRLSFDRGATFGQEIELDPQSAWQPNRLVQIAMASDYTIAVSWWRSAVDGTPLELMLSEGHVAAVDANGSPTWFQFDAPQVLRTLSADASPLLTGLAWSTGGDLVVGYASNTWGPVGNGGWRSTVDYRCAVRLYGGEFTDHAVDREVLVGFDPSVAVLGQGQSLRIYYGYEVRAGVKLAFSNDAGGTFELGAPFGGAGAHHPTVLAREVGPAARVDVVYIGNGSAGRELRLASWADHGTSPREDTWLTQATMALCPPQPGRTLPWGFTGPIDFGLRTTQINWLGYDAVLDGDRIVVAYDEVTQDAAFLCLGAPQTWSSAAGGSGTLASPQYAPATPPPLAPGMTDPMPPVDADHMHQLKLVRIE